MIRLAICAALTLLLAIGCSQRNEDGPASGPPLPAGGDQIEWAGVLACADCDGIQTQLLLQRTPGSRRYVLTETYLADGRRQRFIEHGQWLRMNGLLRLSGDTASTRTYALLPDGSLQPRDSHGRNLPGMDNQTLLPAAFATSH